MKEDELKYWIWFTQIPRIGLITRNELLKVYTSPRDIFRASKNELIEKAGSRLNSAQLECILASRLLTRAETVLSECDRLGISILTRESALIKKTIALGNETPTLLYVKGKVKELKDTVGIVGARRCTQEIKNFTKYVTEAYVEKGCLIVSGMAKGVDAYAQTACVNAGGFTVAVLGCGPDICYPSEHKALMEEIVQTGLLVSEYPPGTAPARYHFPQRNRLIAALSDELVVISAGRGSGAVITADCAEKMNKPVHFVKSAVQ